MGQCCKAMGLGKKERYEELNSNPVVTLDKKWHGQKVEVSNFNVSGSGTALCTAAIHQSRAFYEVLVKSEGKFCVGVSQRSKALGGQLGSTKKSWGLKSHDRFKVDDVIGVAIDLDTASLRFFHNGKELVKERIRGIRGLVYAAVSVSHGAQLDCNFSQSFKHDPGTMGVLGYDGIIPARDVL